MLLNITNSEISCNESTAKSSPRPWDFGEISLLFCLIFGTIGNTLTIMVMRRKRLRNTNASLFVICIALSDILLLLLKFLANMFKMYRIPIYDFCIPLRVLAHSASFISIWLIIITSAERTVAVCLPLKVQTIFSKARCKTIILVTCLSFLGLSSTLAVCIHHSRCRPYYCDIRGERNGKCYVYHNYIFPWFTSIFGSWLPSLLGMTLNLIIIKALYKAAQSRKTITSQSSLTKRRESFVRLEQIDIDKDKINSRNNFAKRSWPSKKSFKFTMNDNTALVNNQSKEKQITIMLLTISFSFILLTLPYAIFELLRKLDVGFRILKSRYAMRVCMMFVDINHATNFLLFCLTAQRFRTELKKILFPRRNIKFIKAISNKPKLALLGDNRLHCNGKTNEAESTGTCNQVNPENNDEIREKSF